MLLEKHSTTHQGSTIHLRWFLISSNQYQNKYMGKDKDKDKDEDKDEDDDEKKLNVEMVESTAVEYYKVLTVGKQLTTQLYMDI